MIHQDILICVSVATLAKENLGQMADYGIDEAGIAELEKLVQMLKEMIPSSRVSITERKTANIKLREVIEKTCDLLDEQLERLVLRYKQSHPGFYADYINARHTIAHGVRHQKQNGQEAA